MATRIMKLLPPFAVTLGSSCARGRRGGHLHAPEEKEAGHEGSACREEETGVAGSGGNGAKRLPSKTQAVRG